MDNNELYKLICLPEEVICKLNIYGKNRKSGVNIKACDLIEDVSLMHKLDKIIAENTGCDTDGIKVLWEELNIAAQSFDEYQKRGIPLDIFIDTMKFCTRFLKDYYKTYSCYHFVWGWWFPRQLSLKEFRIGALEYEYCNGEYINMHIPSDADISKPSVLKSVVAFKDFCHKYYPGWEDKQIWCSSWMLSPGLKNVLDSSSNILTFQELFDVTETDYESMAVLDWVFPGFNEVSENLPEETRLQANMKKYLLAGNKTGWSKGILSTI